MTTTAYIAVVLRLGKLPIDKYKIPFIIIIMKGAQMTDTQNVILTIPQAAERYQLPGITIYIAMRRGEIESYRHGQQWFIYSKSLEMWLGNRPKRGRPYKNGKRPA